jgi:hypothetical protein
VPPADPSAYVLDAPPRDFLVETPFGEPRFAAEHVGRLHDAALE